MTGTGWMRELGQTGISVSAITAGGSPLGSMPVLYGREVSADEGIRTVRAVLDSDIRTMDTANGYSDGESERRIGAGIAQAGGLPADVVVITKVGPKGRDYSGNRVRASVEESRSRLGLDRLPLVHLHDPEGHDFGELTASGGAVDALVRLKESGVVGSIGLAGGPVQEMARYLALGVFDALLVHNRWTLLDRSAGDLLDDAAARGLGLINAAVYGGGILTSPGSPAAARYGYRPAPPEVLDAVEAMRAVCARFGVDLTTAALRVDCSQAGQGRSRTVTVLTTPCTARGSSPCASRRSPSLLGDQGPVDRSRGVDVRLPRQGDQPRPCRRDRIRSVRPRARRPAHPRALPRLGPLA
jgi:D-threo-aldose 1-dehydrogenase